jgi:hypothetical protein
VEREVSVHFSSFRLDWTLGGDFVLEWSIILKKQPGGDQNSPRQGQRRIPLWPDHLQRQDHVSVLRSRYALAQLKSRSDLSCKSLHFSTLVRCYKRVLGMIDKG